MNAFSFVKEKPLFEEGLFDILINGLDNKSCPSLRKESYKYYGNDVLLGLSHIYTRTIHPSAKKCKRGVEGLFFVLLLKDAVHVHIVEDGLREVAVVQKLVLREPDGDLLLRFARVSRRVDEIADGTLIAVRETI